MRYHRSVFPALVLVAILSRCEVAADDFFLTIGGGYAPHGNQASLERNVLYFQRVLARQQLGRRPSTILFSDGDAAGQDLQVKDDQSIPKANRLMAEFFGSTRDLGLHYRNHEIPGVERATSLENIRESFQQLGSVMKPGDRLVLYVTAHGSGSRDRSTPHNTSILLWNNQRLTVVEFVELLDGLPDGVELVTIMVQCHAGGFARCVFNDADPDKGLSDRVRCGFFATVHDRPAAGCTPEVDEANYVEYSTYFWEALSGFDRLGRPVPPPDYDGDGIVSFDEAHAYTVLESDTIDLPIKTSGEFLRHHSRIGQDSGSDLLTEDLALGQLLSMATSSEKAVLEGLASRLALGDAHPIQDARRALKSRSRGSSSSRGRTRGRSELSTAQKLRREIASDIRRRWPELANVLNPLAIELITTRSEEFMRVVESHPDYQRYRAAARQEDAAPDPKKRRVRYERFLRTAENVILAENLRRQADADRIEQFRVIIDAERGTLQGTVNPTPAIVAAD